MNRAESASRELSATPKEARRHLSQRWLERVLPPLACGVLHVETPTGVVLTRRAAASGPEATLKLHSWRAVRRLALGGDIGFGEARVDGDWSSPDIVVLLQLLAGNMEQLRSVARGASLARLPAIWRHVSRDNSRSGSRRNIMAHYDLGNEFYRRWLDRTMLYSSAIWDAEARSLEAAQNAKLRRIAELLDLSPGHEVLEIGCGWGALAIHLAQAAGARVTGVTLSPAQLAWGKEAVQTAAVDGQVDLRLQDYRDVDGQFDRIVSIEMFEAVGEAWWPVYFRTLAERLRRGGRAVLQVITIADAHYESYRRDTDFIQKHIFPGGFLPSTSAFSKAAEAAGLRITASETFGLCYADTLAEWRHRFHGAWSEIAALGFDERFRRLWDYYLAYCEAGFREGLIDVGLYSLSHAPGLSAPDPQGAIA